MGGGGQREGGTFEKCKQKLINKSVTERRYTIQTKGGGRENDVRKKELEFERKERDG